MSGPPVPLLVDRFPGAARGRRAGAQRQHSVAAYPRRCGPVARRHAPTGPSAQCGQGAGGGSARRPSGAGAAACPGRGRRGKARWRAGRSAAVRRAEAARGVPCGPGRSRGAGTCGRAGAGLVGRGRPRAGLCCVRTASPRVTTRDRGRAGGGYRCAALCGRSGGTSAGCADRLRPGRALTGPAAGVQLCGPFPALPSWSCPAGCRCRPSCRPGPGEHGHGQRARLHGAGGAYHERQQKR